MFGHHIGHHGGVDVERGLHMARGSICSCRRLAHRRLWLFGKYQRSGGWPIRMAIAFTPISRSNETKASFCVCTVSIVGGFDRLADGARGEPLLTQSAADIADDATVLSTVVRMGGAEAIPQRPYPLRMKRASKVPVRLDLRTLAARTNCSWAQWSPSREVPLNQRRP